MVGKFLLSCLLAREGNEKIGGVQAWGVTLCWGSVGLPPLPWLLSLQGP